MLNAQCHCGNIKLTASGNTPETLTECNCSICHRYGARWAYFKPDEVQVEMSQPSVTYRWSDEVVDFHHCPICGCLTHYTSTEKDLPVEGRKVAINARMCSREQTESIRIRHFDGANTWQFLD